MFSSCFLFARGVPLVVPYYNSLSRLLLWFIFAFHIFCLVLALIFFG
jgi:hypothetical protein